MTVTILGRLAAGGLQLPVVSLQALTGSGEITPDKVERHMSLSEFCGVQEHTYLMKIEDDSMQGAGLYPGDMIVVDRSQYAEHGHIIFVMLNSEQVCRRLYMRDNAFILQAENNEYPARHVREEDDLVIWGVVTRSIRSYDAA
jgi:DNA polymerase V